MLCLPHRLPAVRSIWNYYDPVGSYAHLSRTYIGDLRAAGAQIAPTSPLYRLHTISYRNHRKITVIDRVIGYTGGMNIGEERFGGVESP